MAKKFLMMKNSVFLELWKSFRTKLLCTKKKYRYVHLMVNDKFSAPFVTFINEHFDARKHCFIFYNSNSKFVIPTQYENVVVCQLQSIDINLQKVKKIFIHSLSATAVNWFYDNKSLLKRCYWIVWGYDIYGPENEQSRFVKENVKAVITNFDKTTYLNKYHKDKTIYELPFYPSVVSKKYLDSAIKNPAPITVQINNSADGSTLEMLDILAKFSSKNLRITTILSYAQTQFNEEIIKKGTELFGDKFFAVTDYLEPEEYANHIKNIDILILNQSRQQGVGNIRCNLYLGHKVYIRSEITTYRGFINKGYKIFDSNKIKNMNFEEFIYMDKNDAHNNQRLLQSYFDDSELVASWRYFLKI